MRSVIVIHIALILTGIALGLFGEYEMPEVQMPWMVLLFVTPVSTLIVILVLGFFVLLSNSSPVKYLFWLFYLLSVFGLAVGVGFIIQSLYVGQVIPESFFTLLGALGYLPGLSVVAKLQRWRHHEAF